MSDNEYDIYLNDAKEINSEEWDQGINHKLNMDNFSMGDYDPGIDILEKEGNKFGLFIPHAKGNDIVNIDQDVNPYQGICFGFIDCFARVSCKSSSIGGILILHFDSKKLGNVDRDSLRLFKWNEGIKFFQLVQASAVGKEDYVWGIISSPGIYSLIGLNSDPSISPLLKIISDNADQLRTLEPEMQRKYFYKVSKELPIPKDLFTNVFKDGSDLKG